jgi:hypothetical protein
MPDRSKGFDVAGFIADMFSEPYSEMILGKFFGENTDDVPTQRAPAEVKRMQEVGEALGLANWPGWSRVLDQIREEHAFCTSTDNKIMADDAFVRGVREALGMNHESPDELLAGIKTIIEQGSTDANDSEDAHGGLGEIRDALLVALGLQDDETDAVATVDLLGRVIGQRDGAQSALEKMQASYRDAVNQREQTLTDERAFHAALYEIAQAVGGLDPVHDELEPDSVVAKVHDIMHGSKAKTDTHAKLFDDFQATNRRLVDVADKRNEYYGYLLDLVRLLGEDFGPSTVGDGVDAAKTRVSWLRNNLGRERFQAYSVGAVKPEEDPGESFPHIKLRAGDIIRADDEVGLGSDPHIAVSYRLSDSRWVFTVLADPEHGSEEWHELRQARDAAHETVQARNHHDALRVEPEAPAPAPVKAPAADTVHEVLLALIDETFGHNSVRGIELRTRLGVID